LTESDIKHIALPDMPGSVASVYASFPDAAQTLLGELRALIFQEAAANSSVGALSETLKWREPAYVTERPKSGTTIRLCWKEKTPDQSALFVSCQTSLIDDWKELYGSVLNFSGNRAVLFDHGQPYPKDAVRHCIAMALTYHLKGQR